MTEPPSSSPVPEPAASAPSEPADGRIEHPRVRYERRDIRVRWIIGILIFFGCIGVAHLLLLWWLLHWQMEIADRAKRSPYPLAPQPSTRLPLPPRLEQLDRMEGRDISDVFQREAARLRLLESYGPTDDPGYLHIPIEQALERLADRLPVRKQPPPSGKDHGLVDSGESNSGRMARGGSP